MPEVSSSRGLSGLEFFELDLRHARSGHSQRKRCWPGEVNNAPMIPARVGPAVIDRDNHRSTILQVRYPNDASEGERPRRGGQRMAPQWLPACGPAADGVAAIPACQSYLG